jgi:hypothetical protein
VAQQLLECFRRAAVQRQRRQAGRHHQIVGTQGHEASDNHGYDDDSDDDAGYDDDSLDGDDSDGGGFSDEDSKPTTNNHR